jgi:hypothetical protein
MEQKTAWKFSSKIACLLAALVTAGSHWFVLQLAAWACMLVNFAQQDSFATAVQKTFDGQHPCNLCLQIREGQQQDRQDSEKQPWLNPEKMPELLLDVRLVTIPPAPAAEAESPPFVHHRYADFIDDPLKPPPRQSAATV